jgi:hypothetical protein
MGIYEGRGQLAKAVKELMHKWSETKNYWQDAVAGQFEQDRLQNLEKDAKVAMSAMDHMASLIQQARHDAGE